MYDFNSGGGRLQPRSVAIGDLNGDGKPDLVAGKIGTVSVLFGNGDGTFGSKSEFGTGGAGSSEAVAIGDLNGDGKPDLVTANSNTATVSVLLNTGDRNTATLLAEFEATTTADGIELRWMFGDPSRVRTVAVERAVDTAGPWLSIAPELHEEAGVTVALDRATEGGRAYFYRLVVQLTDGGWVVFGPVSASHLGPPSMSALTLVSPNPTSGHTQVDYEVARTGRVQLEVLDVSGRVEETLADRIQTPGRYVVAWDEAGPRGRLAPGLYFIRLVAPDRVAVKKLAAIR